MPAVCQPAVVVSTPLPEMRPLDRRSSVLPASVPFTTSRPPLPTVKPPSRVEVAWASVSVNVPVPEIVRLFFAAVERLGIE